MDQNEKAKALKALHTNETPLVLYNAWDAGSAKIIQDAGAPAIATSSWAIAAAHGYRDGEVIPLPLVEPIVARMSTTLRVPLTFDFEGGYTEDPDILASNIAKFLDAGVAGINFEDRIVSGQGLYDVRRQCRRIAAIRKAAEQHAVPLFINARTDLFFGTAGDPSALMEEAKERAAAYAEAGASGFFVPGLSDETLIEHLCKTSPLPINIMVTQDMPDILKLSKLGVARISFGPIPFLKAMEALKIDAQALYAGKHQAP